MFATRTRRIILAAVLAGGAFVLYVSTEATPLRAAGNVHRAVMAKKTGAPSLGFVHGHVCNAKAHTSFKMHGSGFAPGDVVFVMVDVGDKFFTVQGIYRVKNGQIETSQFECWKTSRHPGWPSGIAYVAAGVLRKNNNSPFIVK